MEMCPALEWICAVKKNVLFYHLPDTVRFAFMYTACDLNENVLHYHLPDTVRLCLCNSM